MTRLGRYLKQKEYIEDLLNGFPERISRIKEATSSAAYDMASKDREECKQLLSMSQQPAWPS